MKLNKLVAPILVSAMLTQAVPALAVSQHPFTDVPTWASEAVAYSYEKGYVNGTTPTTYNSNGEISIVEFIKVMVQMCTTEDQRTTILEEAGATPEQIATDWTHQYRVIGEKIGLYDGLEQYAADKGETKCTRAIMAHILVNALEVRQEAFSAADAETYIFYLNDSTDILYNSYAADIGIAVSLGLISGDNNRNFNPDGYMNRASAAQVFIRLDNPNGERQSALDFIVDDSENKLEPITIHEGQGASRVPQPGDTYIKADGTQITLEMHPSGVLGFGQAPYMDYWTNTTGDDGWHLELGSRAVATINGVNVSGNLWAGPCGVYTRAQWEMIENYTRPTTNGTQDGQTTADGLWVWEVSPSISNWAWFGPRL